MMAKRRGNQEGSIFFHKPSGKWCAQVSLDGHRPTKYFDTQRECREWIKEITAQIDQGLTFQASKLRMDEYLAYWHESIKGTIKHNGWIDYGQAVKNHIIPTLGNKKLNTIKSSDIQRLMNKKREEGQSPWRLQYIRRVLNKAMGQAVSWGVITYNPVKAVTIPKVPKKEMKVWDKDQAKSFLAYVEGHRLEALYYLAFTTGMRQGELLGLHWLDLDWENNRIQVKRQLRRVREKGLMFEELKTETSQREIVLADSTIAILKKHKEFQQKEILLAGERWKENEIVFPSTIGSPLEPRNLYRHFVEVTKKLGLPKIRFHDLRHTAATLMLIEGIHPKVVQERLGHSSVTLTLDTYSHVIPSMQTEVVEKLDKLLK
ncbi:MAG: site-specific integrase [Chloroflexi bacterium]|nr:site-specific integrase [Chloroflexota bacterium]